MSDQPVITRYAPSPTGEQHIGGARTALFAWAFARKHGGTFLLRFEDTDRARSTEASAVSIERDLRWLGIDWDNTPEYQSQRLDLYNEHITRLLDAGLAYEDDGAVRFRMGRDITFDDAVYGRIEVAGKELEDFVIRKGAAGDHFPTFHLAVVVDDALMGVTHIIRGQEHLTNTPKHAALYDALGYDRPVWAHTPSIMNADGSKMSKRDKAKAARAAGKQAAEQEGLQQFADRVFQENKGRMYVPESQIDIDQYQKTHTTQDIIEFLDGNTDDLIVAWWISYSTECDLPDINVKDFQNSGYLPDVLCNYIALLGWNPGNDVERFDRDFLVENFGLDRIGKKNARFDREKLFRFNADTIAALPPEDFAGLLAEHFEAYHESYLHKFSDEQFGRFAEAYQPRARTLDEPAQLGQFFVMPDDEITYDFNNKGVKKAMFKGDPPGIDCLRDFRNTLSFINTWTGAAAHGAMEAWCNERSEKLGKLAQPIRVAVAGTPVTPPIDLTLEILGKESTLERIDRCLTAAPKSD